MSVLENVIADAFTNIGVSYQDWLLIGILLGCLLMFAVGLRIGLVVASFMLAGGYVMFSLIGLPVFNILIAFLMSIVLLSLSLLFGRSSTGLV